MFEPETLGLIGSVLWPLVDWVIRLAMLAYLPQQRSTAAAMAWLLFIFPFPIPGLLVYLVLGRTPRSALRIDPQQQLNTWIKHWREKQQSAIKKL